MSKQQGGGVAAFGSRARDPKLIDTTARLVDFLRELATARREQVRDVTRYEQVHWLADLPDQVVGNPEAAAGEVVLSFDSPISEPPPDLPERLQGWVDRHETSDAELDAPQLRQSGPVEVIDVDQYGHRSKRIETRSLDEVPEIRQAYDFWELEWQAWATRERVILNQRRWYRNLHGLANLLAQREDEYEVVLATGLLTWTAPNATRIRNHLLGTRAEVLLDAETQRIDVLLEAGVARLQDRELLDGLTGFEAARTNRLRERVRGGEGVGLQDSVVSVLKEWCDRALEHGVVYRDEWESGQAAAVAEVRTAPALVLRTRDRASLIDYYDRMLAALSGPDAAAPLGLAQLVTSLEAGERLEFLEEQGATPGSSLGADPLFPLPANPEQRQIMTRLRGDNGVVVQGPPGTGKTHTIANLIAALLAQGQRVLVTSQKAQALRVLREKLPAEIAQLCVSMTDLGRGGSTELEGSVKTLSSRFAGFSPELLEQDLVKRRERRRDARSTEAALIDRIRALRETETYQHGEVAPGYRGRLADIAERLKRHEPDCGWMPVPLPDVAAGTPPINGGEASELLTLLAAETPERKARTSQLIPEVSALPFAEQVRALIVAEAAASNLAREARTELSAQLAGCRPEALEHLEAAAESVAAAVERLALPADPQAWENSDWAVRAIGDGLARRDTLIWDQLTAYETRAGEARSALQMVGLRRVTLPTFQPSGQCSEAAQLEAARRLHDYFVGGGKLKRSPFKPAVQRQAEPLLAEALVDGVSPSSAELLAVVIAELEGRAACAELNRGWRLVGVEIPSDQPLPLTVAQFGDCYDRLARVREVWAAVGKTRDLLAAEAVRLQLSTPAQWFAYASSLHAVRLRVEADRATGRLDTLRSSLDLEIRKGQAPPELREAATAVGGRDAGRYEQCLRGLASAHLELREQARCDELRDRVRATHPALATLIGRTCGDDVWQRRLGTWEQAWAWGKAETFFAAQRQPGLERQLDAELEGAAERVLKASGELAARQAWGACMSRMTAHQAQALRAYQGHMGKRGAGTGRYASRYEGRAREAMTEAIPAVPAWIMPLRQVLETVPADRDSFDVVIVDEASQASIEALFLLWLAPRVIVVGDDKQCAPSAVSHGELEPLFEKLATYLPDVPGYLRDAFTPNSSLFDILGTRFGSVIRLREHFRCMPEIIEYSSRQFYPDEPLVPLRQFGADRLPPLRAVQVHGATTDGTGTRLRNEVEAEAIVTQILACSADPAYQGKTFGVVVLQGSGQVQLIHNKLLERMDTSDWDQRKLRIGTPPDFQGDERDVIFLSMVIAERRGALTRLELQRRFNVAASRARDQMWLFHSVSPDLLSPTDLRRSLLTYVLNPPTPFADDAFDHVTANTLVPPFESLFEQRVFLKIRERGYHVVPQVEVNGRRIDLVVTGANGRLAVECDGDFWHSTPEDRENDFDRERELKRAGWRFWRVRESEFYFDPDIALTSLWDELDRRGIRPGEVGESQADATATTWSAVDLPEEDGEDGLDDESLSTGARANAPTGQNGLRTATDTDPASPPPVAPDTTEPAIPDDPDLEEVRQAGPPLRPGRAVTGYNRAELQALLRWVAADGLSRSEDDLVAAATDILASRSPRDQVEGLLRAALRHMRRR
ncbi:AAA domain-containing protein [Actinopolymorpha pittospori]|uniref:Very-short-patch-repair endonuclease n=1 Tax=Actinopolymorpha pittospori TaxID=648752 RepID=A0A927MN35_9ACTN|nr:AAA domain-containing protein [Actinopolymorpha pittospori]MBE1603726.1 very-short-patch-repair endonuclease [Actinopolymorpha pittospori]